MEGVMAAADPVGELEWCQEEIKRTRHDVQGKPPTPVPRSDLLRWCAMALMAAGALMVVATLLHPSRETATTIVASEPRLVAAHVAYTFAWLLVLLGLPGFYAAQRGGMARLGLVGF